jgi:phosphinothricin acetyltransferase
VIRFATKADVAAILNIYRPYILTTAYTFEYDVPSLEDFTKRFETISGEFPWLVWEENGEILGYAYGERAFVRAAYQWDADLAIYLRQDVLGKGIGKALYGVVEEILRRQGYFVAYGIVTTANAGSCAFHEAMGYEKAAEFHRCGFKFGQWHGTVWYEKRLRNGLPQVPPVSLHQIDCSDLL